MNTFRNYINVVRRYKVAFGLNLLGLAVALTVAAMVFMQLRYDYGFDEEQGQRENIYMLHMDVGGFGKIGVAPRPLVPIIKDCPGVEAVAIADPMTTTTFVTRRSHDGREVSLKESYLDVDSGYTEVFDFAMVEQNGEVLQEQGKLLIPESMAAVFAPDGDALGMVLDVDGKMMTVNGVYRDFAPNSTLRNCIYKMTNPTRDLEQWGNLNYNLFLRVAPGTDAGAVLEQVKKGIMEGYGEDSEMVKDCSLVSLADLHFDSSAYYDMTPKADKGMLMLFLTIALAIVVIACINLTNFNTALSPLRVRCVNTMKVLGSGRGSLVGGIVGESVLVGVAAWLLSLGLLLVVKGTALAGLISAEIDFGAEWPVLLCGLALAVLTGGLAGLYPALYLTSFQPALALKGNFALTPKGRRIRSTLVAFQFLVSFVLLGYVGTIAVQNSFMKNLDMGYDKDKLLVTWLEGRFDGDDTKTLKQRLLALPEVENCGFASVTLSAEDNISRWGRELRGEVIMYTTVSVDEDFFDTVGATVTEGRGFREGDSEIRQDLWVFNEMGRRVFDLTLDDTLDGDPVVGFVSDMRVYSLRGGLSPVGFIYDPDGYYHGEDSFTAYVRLAEGADVNVAKRKVLEVLQEMVPYYPFNVMDSDDVFASTYADEQNSSLTISVFSVLAVLISLIGVFGLVAFDSEARRKEIAVRKVMGAETGDIVRSFNRSYLLILLVCFVLAVPVSLYFSRQWLGNFAEHASLPLWVFVPALLLMALIVCCTVTAQCWRIADSNPSQSLKNE